MGFCVLLLLVVFPGVEPASSAIESSANTEGSIQIAPGSSMHREIAGGVTEVFAISLEEGKLLRFLIDKGDLVLSAVLYGPAGTKLLEHVSQDFEVVEISFPADVTGTYLIEIRSSERGETPRQYELRVEPSKIVTPQDRKDSYARLAVASAGVLRANWTEASIRQAIKKYDEAAMIWTSMSKFSRASFATMRSADLHSLLSEFALALKQYQSAAALAKKSGDLLAEGRALSHMGLLHSYLGKNDLAKKHLTRALELLRSDPSPMAKNAYAEGVSNLAEVNYSKGNLLKSLNQFEEARKLFEHDRSGEAKTRLFIGYITGSLGAPEKALLEISQALTLYQSVSNRDGEGRALTALGLFHSFKNDMNRGTESHRNAIQIFRSIGDRQGEAMALNALGQAFEKVGEYSVARENYESALRLFQNIGGLDFAAVTTFAVARIYRLLGEVDRALAHYEHCLALSRAAGKVRTEAHALNEIATIYTSQGSYEQALKQHRRIQKFYESIHDLQSQALALNTYGDLLLKLGRKQQALDVYRNALHLSEEVDDKDILISTFYNLARVHSDLGDYETARTFIEQSLKIIEDLRTNVGSPDVRASYVSSHRKNDELYISILMQLHRVRPGEGFDVAAFLASEKNRARSLRDQLQESQTHLRQGVSDELLQRRQELRASFRAQAQYQIDLSHRNTDATEIAEVESQIAQLRSQYQETEAHVWARNPHQLPLIFTAFGLEQMQKELSADDTMLLEYSLGDERSYLWAVTANSLHSYELPDRKTIEDAAREVYELLTVRQRFYETIDGDYVAKVEASDKRYLEKASTLSQMLLGPIAGQLGTRRLLLVTEGALQYVSFEALPLPGVQSADPNASATQPRPWLLETNEIDVLPSMSTLLGLRAARTRPASPGKIVAVLADPVLSRSDDRVKVEGSSPAIANVATNQSTPAHVQVASEVFEGNSRLARLSHASEEADAISAAAARGTSMVAKGFDASRETAMSSSVGEYQIVHFATHGFLDSEHPELSSIVLTMVDRNGAEKNGLMSLHDIYSLDLSAELTVLSACQTALGKDIKGEGLVGLTHSFMSAGSKSVVASLWKVDDRATSTLMSNFYESMLQKGNPPATALRMAKLKMMQDRRWSEPYYWAGFVFQGDYASRIAVDHQPWFRPRLALLLLLILIGAGLLVVQKRKRRSSPPQSA
jgi:CHAT domain-containing protein/tetratricopeptide (TPR) repeat protein